jgi:negative regulator of flagellin synthesis FlgM
MKINGISQNNMINSYNDNKKKVTNKSVIENKDSVQISNAGRSLSNLTAEGSCGSSPSKVEAVAKQVAQGTYSPNPKLIAQKMYDMIKGREI